MRMTENPGRPSAPTAYKKRPGIPGATDADKQCPGNCLANFANYHRDKSDINREKTTEIITVIISLCF